MLARRCDGTRESGIAGNALVARVSTCCGEHVDGDDDGGGGDLE